MALCNAEATGFSLYQKMANLSYGKLAESSHSPVICCSVCSISSSAILGLVIFTSRKEFLLTS